MSVGTDLSVTISKPGLLWGLPGLQPWVDTLSPEVRQALFHSEIHDWVSSMYWGETLGIQYALLMSRNAETEEDQAFWLKVLGEEVDHQQRLASWLGFRGHRPLPPNRLLDQAMRRLARVGTKPSPQALAALILWGQVFFEELGATLIRWRLPHVLDRELRAVLYKIYSDEMAHISAGKRALEKAGVKIRGRKDVLLKRASSIFPLHLLPDEFLGERDSIRRVGLQAVLSFLEKSMTEGERYRTGHLVQRWMKVEGYHCIGCHPKRSEGLLLDPYFDSEKGESVDILAFSRRFEGMNDLVHGGFISMALDEVMGYAINHQYNRLAFTTQLEVNFKKPVRVGKSYRISGRVETLSGQRAAVVGAVSDPVSGELVAESRASFYVLNIASAAKLLPGALKTEETRAMLEG